LRPDGHCLRVLLTGWPPTCSATSRIVRLKSQSLTHISKDKPSAKKPQVLQTPPPV
jgi:hypothetical protein